LTYKRLPVTFAPCRSGSGWRVGAERHRTCPPYYGHGWARAAKACC